MFSHSFNKSTIKKFFFTKSSSRGFTLVELVVVMGIGVLIMTTIVGGQSKYTDAVALKGLANDVSLDLRQAQVYGISVKVSPTDNTDFNGIYGLSFNKSYVSDYIAFKEGSGTSGVYDSNNHTSCSGECLLINTINRGNKINQLCRIPNSGSEDCTLGRADITFVRPSTEARIIYFNSSGGVVSGTGYKGLRTEFISPGGLKRSVVIYTSGQISVQ
jgi:prepilin-type N-terminal cleavage/methylation domain-containing protein